MVRVISFSLMLLLLSVSVLADSSVRFDWSYGEPSATDDSSNTAKYAWAWGQSAIVEEYTVAAARRVIIIED